MSFVHVCIFGHCGVRRNDSYIIVKKTSECPVELMREHQVLHIFQNNS
jgi:hypothetical protein